MNSSRHIADVIVLGGGPAGAAAATLLARAKARVVLINKARAEYREGEILDSRGFRLLERIGVTKEELVAVATSLPGQAILWGERTQQISPVSNPYGAGRLVRRNGFDAVLQAIALRAGAEVIQVAHAPDLSRAGSVWFAETAIEDRLLRAEAPLLVDCTGRAGAVVRRYGKPTRLDRLVCDYYLTQTACDDEAQWRIAAAEDGWWFTVRVAPRLRVFCRFHEAPVQPAQSGLTSLMLPSSFQDLLDRFDLATMRSFRVDASTTVRAIDHPDLASAGDAAFTIDPLSGQGMSLAVANGILAGNACLRRLAGSRTAMHDLMMLQAQEFRSALRQRSMTYSRCSRWPDASFWRKRRSIDVIP